MKRLIAALSLPMLLVGCGGGSKSAAAAATTGSPSAQTVTLDMSDALMFKPNVVDAKVGTVTFSIVNTGVIPHNFTFNDHSLGHTPTINGKTTMPLKVTFAKPGTYTFQCTFHPGMVGKVIVS